MNANISCHEIADCPGLYVDAFRTTKYLHEEENCLILSHYHGDHYGSLPHEYNGPARIHCTPITARLLREIHQIQSDKIVEHDYGETWDYCSKMTAGKAKRRKTVTATKASITFYDAHHCPGAAIILIELPDLQKAHLHTGDMRYNEKMLDYPRLKEVVKGRTLDTVFLDTTYALATRKYSFPSQMEAVEDTARQVSETLRQSQDEGTKTLVLVSAYNIGKEKCLWRIAQSTNHCQKLYATPKKKRMLQLCTNTASSDFVERYCTDDPLSTNIHIVPMHLAGKMWPFFQPNFQACAKYAEENKPHSLNDGRENYDKVVVFCPTGWAAANNWNRRNNVRVCPQTKVPGSERTMHVEVRLIPYSEHSNLSELQTLINDHWKPRCIVPTVYKTEAEERQILDLFRVDRNRAKKYFLQKMMVPSEISKSKLEDSRKEQATNDVEIIARGPTANCGTEDFQLNSSGPQGISAVESQERSINVSAAATPITSLGSDSDVIDLSHDDDRDTYPPHGKLSEEEEKLISMGFDSFKVRAVVENIRRTASGDSPLNNSNLFDQAVTRLLQLSGSSPSSETPQSAKKRKRKQQTLNFFAKS